MAILESPSACIAAEEGVIAKAVLMPGDPLRAKFVAEHYLENPVCFNTVRNMLGYTGTYRGKPVSVMVMPPIWLSSNWLIVTSMPKALKTLHALLLKKRLLLKLKRLMPKLNSF